MEKKIDFFGDYHTHTKYSHGKGTIAENVRAAEDVQLKELAITDHGLKHIGFSLESRDLKKVRKEIDDQNKISSVHTLFGVEANIQGESGKIDIKDCQIGYFDIVLVGFHKFVWPYKFRDIFGFMGGNILHDFLKIKSSNSARKRNTKAFIKAIEKYEIDIITHIGYGIAVDFVEIAKAARDYGTLIEINSKRITTTDEIFLQMVDTGVNFIVNSDAHTPQRVGEFSLGTSVVERLNIDLSRIANVGAKPKFRSSLKK